MDIEGYEGLYKIYNDGKLWCCRKNRFVKLCEKNQGYQQYGLYDKDTKQKSFKIHRLVATAYIPNPNNYLEIDHINRVRNDNRVENLRWVTHTMNAHNKNIFKNNKTGVNNLSKIWRPEKNKFYWIANIQRKIDGKMKSVFTASCVDREKAISKMEIFKKENSHYFS